MLNYHVNKKTTVYTKHIIKIQVYNVFKTLYMCVSIYVCMNRQINIDRWDTDKEI